MTPIDPRLAAQWHFPLIGNISRVWDEYTGTGVRVGVYDDGVEATHEDLAANYNSSRHLVVGGVTYNGAPVMSDDGHGTSVAGLIAGDNNGLGGVGVAFDAQITGVNIFGGGALDVNSGAQFMTAVSMMSNFDVTNNSWGSTPNFSGGQNITLAGSFSNRLNAGYEAATINGRGGLGTIILQAAGNDNRITGGSGDNVSRYNVTVGATDSAGKAAYYSNYGTDLLVSAPAGGNTTDRTGAAGYDPTAYTTAFGGTSAATPVTAGVVSLMLDANESLTWRDVHNILAASATRTGSTLGAVKSGEENYGWQFNKAENWNGAGNHYSLDYGFGMVNAFNAARMAEAWTYFERGDVSRAAFATGENTTDFAIPDSAAIPVPISSTIAVTAAGEAEYLRVTIQAVHTYGADLRISLISARGTEYALYDGSGGGSTWLDAAPTWGFGVEGLRGESITGNWTLKVVDVDGGDVGTLQNFKIDFYGRNATEITNDLFTYTDEYALVKGVDPSVRGTLTDTDGGTDSLNFAAVTSNVTLTMAGATYAGSVLFSGVAGPTIAVGTMLERAVMGDGNDTIYGNEAANRLYGMRGNDFITGGAGDDSIDGGQGSDQVWGWTGNDTLDGGAGVDSLYGYDGDDLLIAGLGADLMSGGIGSDTISYAASTDATYIDLLYQNGYGSIALGDTFDGIEQVNGSSFNDGLWGGNSGDIFLGGAGNDSLDGRLGNDSLFGGADVDTLLGGMGGDDLTGGLGADVLNGGDDVDFVRYDGSLTGIQIDLLYSNAYGGEAQGDSFISVEGVYGSNLDDGIWGTNGDDTAFTWAGGDYVDGRGGVDVILAGAGADTLIGGIGADYLQGDGAADIFRYTSLFDSTASAMDNIADFSSAQLDKIDVASALVGYGTATFNSGWGTGASVYAYNQGAYGLVQVYTGSTLQLQFIVNQANLSATDFLL